MRPSSPDVQEADRTTVSVSALSSDGGRITAEITGLGEPFTLEYGFPFAVETPSADALVAACLVPAMRAGMDLVVRGRVSSSLMSSSVRFQEQLSNWFPENAMVEIHADPVPRAPRTGDGKVACFFTAGVDSFYSVLKHRDEIDELIFVHGYEASLRTAELRSMVSDALRSAARDLDLPLVEVECNLRTFADRHVSWLFYHGAALASVGLVSGRYERVFIPSTHPYEGLIPYGSHPLLDPLWSTEQTEIVHDGAEATRPHKIAVLASHEVPLRWLRVCYENADVHYNCGRCEKCLRTMIALELAGALQDARTFPSKLRLLDVARIRAPGADKAAFLRENLDAIRGQKGRGGLGLVLRSVLLRGRLRESLAAVKRRLVRRSDP